MAEYKITLDGGPPWGIRLHNQPVKVSAVNPGSKAHRQGIETGDQILSINDQTVQDIDQAQQLVRNASNSLVLQLRRAPREATFSRPSRPTFLCDSRQPAAHEQSPTDSNLDQDQHPRRTLSDNFSSTQPPTAINSVEKIHNSRQKISSAILHKVGESVTGNNSSEHSSEISTPPPSKMIESEESTRNETRTAISGPPMSPSFKVKGGISSQIWSPTQPRSVAVKEFYANNVNHQEPNYPSGVPPSSHSSLSTASTADDRSGHYNMTSTHNGVYSPSSSSSGIMSGTNSERTDDGALTKDYDDRITGSMYRSANQEPHSVMFVDRTNADFSKLPRSQNPTVTLLQKAREGNLHSKTPTSYATQNSNQQEFYHATSVPSSRGNSEIIHHTFAAPAKYEGIGPTNEKGMPTALRSVVKEDKQHDWYKKMFKAIHRPEDETDFVLVKYQNPRKGSRYSPTPKNHYLSDAYMSEPELGREDNYPHYSTTSDVETSRDYSDFARTHSLPRTKKDATFDEPRGTVVNENPYKYRTSPPKGQSDSQWRPQVAPKVEAKSWMPAGTQRFQPEPRKLDNYEPGRSSISMHEALQDRDWKRQTDLYNPPPENPKPQYSMSTVASGNIKPDTGIYRRNVSARAMSPEEQRDIYKEVQMGGDVPLSGLRMLTPQKAKEVNPDQLTSVEYAQWRKVYALETLLPEAQTIRKNCTELPKPILRFAQVSEKPILREQPLIKFSFFKSTYEPEEPAEGVACKRLFRDLIDIGKKKGDLDRDCGDVTSSATQLRPGRGKWPKRQRANSVDGRSPHPTDIWLQKMQNDLDSLEEPLTVSRENLGKISSSHFRNRLSFQMRIPADFGKKTFLPCTLHSSVGGTLFSSLALQSRDLSVCRKSLPQSKTSVDLAESGAKIVGKREKADGEKSSLSVFQKRREERMQRLTRRMFSLSRDAAPLVHSKFGRVKKLSQKYETWQRVRSASGSPTPAKRNPKVFSYTDSGALDIWNAGKDRRRMATSQSLSQIAPAAKEVPRGLVKSKSTLPGSRATLSSNSNPYRHVGFELLESSLSLDDKMTSVSSFADSGLDYFHRGSVSSLSSSETGCYRDLLLTDVDYGSLFGADAQRMELDIDRIAAPPSKKPLTDAGTRTLSARDFNSSYYSTPVRSTTATLERKSSRATDYDDIEFDLQSEYKKIDEIYEREREKRQKSNQLDEERRRHNYVPTQTKSPVPGDRYDSVYDDPFNFRPGRPRSVSPGILGFARRDRARSTSSQGGDFLDNEMIGPARALYNFTAQNPRELSFRQGDIVQVLRLLDENWIEGECNNRSGIAPASYLESMNSDRRRRMEKLAQEGQARAKYDFNAQSQVEMSLKKGEIIVLIRKVDKNWYEGKIGARRGILPVAYVEVLKQPGTDPSTSTVQPRQTSPSPARPSNPPVATFTPAKSPGPSRKSSMVLEGSDRGTFGENVLKEFKTQVSQSPDGPSSALRRNSAKSSIEELLIPPPPTTTVQEELDLLRRAPERCRVLYNYRKQHEDELELREGEIIDVTERCDDGWFNGKNKRGDQGYFPGNYVQCL